MSENAKSQKLKKARNAKSKKRKKPETQNSANAKYYKRTMLLMQYA